MSTELTGYSAFFWPVKSALNALKIMLRKAQNAPNAASLPSARLYEDMQPLTFQIHVVCDTIDKMVFRTTGSARLKWTDDMSTFEDMQNRIAAAEARLDSASQHTVNKTANETIALPGDEGDNTVDVPIHLLMSAFTLPTLFFHVVTAYGILRKEGVPLGKSDYIGPFQDKLDEGAQK
jgi:hypothetical protein